MTIVRSGARCIDHSARIPEVAQPRGNPSSCDRTQTTSWPASDAFAARHALRARRAAVRPGVPDRQSAGSLDAWAMAHRRVATQPSRRHVTSSSSRVTVGDSARAGPLSRGRPYRVRSSASASFDLDIRMEVLAAYRHHPPGGVRSRHRRPATRPDPRARYQLRGTGPGGYHRQYCAASLFAPIPRLRPRDTGTSRSARACYR